jgi:molybdate transport system substrate-binding protein
VPLLPFRKCLVALVAIALIGAWACRTNTTNQETTLTVAAAADLSAAFEEMGRAFESQTNTKIVFTFGSTGILTQQIMNGAPYDLFAAAHISYIEQLEKQNLILPDTKAIYARGHITLWTTKDAAFKLQKIEELIKPEVKRIAIANPDHAPYGLAARQALESAGIWDVVKPKLIYADNIRQTLQFAQTGNVDVAIVALSLSLPSDGQWALIPQALHKPIDQGLAVIKGTKHEQSARRLAAFINSPAGQTIMKKYGFGSEAESEGQSDSARISTTR